MIWNLDRMEHASNLQMLQNLVLLGVQNLEHRLFHTLVKPQRKSEFYTKFKLKPLIMSLKQQPTIVVSH